jgi:hypothetical protein
MIHKGASNMSRRICAFFLTAAAVSMCFGSSAFAQRTSSRSESRYHISSESQNEGTESIDTVLRFLNIALDPSLNCDVQEYFGPERVRLGRNSAAVFRVIYEVNNQKGFTADRDQLYLVQNGTVVRWVDTAAQVAVQQQIRRLLESQAQRLNESNEKDEYQQQPTYNAGSPRYAQRQGYV